MPMSAIRLQAPLGSAHPLHSLRAQALQPLAPLIVPFDTLKMLQSHCLQRLITPTPPSTHGSPPPSPQRSRYCAMPVLSSKSLQQHPHHPRSRQAPQLPLHTNSKTPHHCWQPTPQEDPHPASQILPQRSPATTAMLITAANAALGPSLS